MASLNEMITNVRLLLLEPRPQKPSLRLLYKFVLDQTQSMFNRLSNTNKAWATGEAQLTVSPDEEDYYLNANTNFGKPLLVTTVDTSNPSHIERSIDFFEVQNLNYNWDYPNDLGNSFFFNLDGSDHTALRMAFFREGGASPNIKVRIKPKPMRSAEYRIMYSLGNWIDEANITDSPHLTEHHHLLETRAALRALPACEWWDDGDEAGARLNAMRRKELEFTLDKDESRFATEFERYVSSMRVSKITQRVSYGGDW